MSTSNENVKCLVSTKNKTPIYWAVEKNDLALIEKIATKMTWKFNPTFSNKVLANTEQENFMGMTIGGKKGKASYDQVCTLRNSVTRKPTKYLLAKVCRLKIFFSSFY